MKFEEEVKEFLTIYERMLERYKTELEGSPDGNLLHQKKGKYDQFLYSYNEDGKRLRIGINNDKDLVKALAKKEFASRATKILENNINAIREAVSKQIPFDPDQILKSMTKAYALLPEEYFFDRNKLIISSGLDDELVKKIKRHEEWWKRPYKEYWGFPERKTKLTSRRQKVRSLSELLIAEKLYEYSIPFHYEEELEVNGRTFAPDFTFEGADYNNFYLDYFGMMDNVKYAKKNFLKLDDYYDIGLIPGNNLIVVFDSNGVINAGAIESLIHNEIIPRL